MVVVKVKAGYEDIHEQLLRLKNGLEEKVRLQLAEDFARIDRMLAECIYEEEVEEKPVIEETKAAEVVNENEV